MRVRMSVGRWLEIIAGVFALCAAGFCCCRRRLGSHFPECFSIGPSAGIVTETEFEGAGPWAKLPVWISSPTADIASRRRSSSTRSGFISGSP
jgi:hypothetical protein